MIVRNPSSRRTRCWAVLVSGVSFLMLSILVVAPNSSAQLAVVHGYVTDQVGNPLEGVNVTVNIYDSGLNLVDTKWDDATDEDGYYTVSFGGFTGDHEPEVDDTIEVVAVYLSEPPASNSLVVESVCPVYSIDVEVSSVVIPEFGLGQSIGLPLAIIGVVAIFAVMGRRRAR
jgi:hypothetical protein